MVKTNRFRIWPVAALGLSALMFGLAGTTSARADTWDNYGKGHVYREIADVRRDERILRELQAEHDEARRCHDWRRMHDLDRRISDLRRHINEDRRDIRRDLDRRRDNARYDGRYDNGRSDRYRTTDRVRYRDDR